jgi:hypothetical protein
MNQDSAAFMDGYKMAAVQLLDSFAAENPQVLFTMCIPDSSKRLCLPS